jgi:hypothetical protein
MTSTAPILSLCNVCGHRWIVFPMWQCDCCALDDDGDLSDADRDKDR